VDLTEAQRASSQQVGKVQRVSDGFVASSGCNGDLKDVFTIDII